MDTEVILVLAVLALVWLGVIILRVPAFFAFFSLLVGQIISSEVSVGGFDQEFVKIGLLLAPFVVTVILLKGRAPKSKLIMEFLPAFSTAIVLLLFLYPLVDEVKIGLDMASNDQIEKYRSWFLVACSGVVLVSGLFSYPKSHEGKHHK